MRERVLITGASGFVGYHLIEEALKNNLEVYAAVRKSSKLDHLKHLDIKYTSPQYSDVAALTHEIKDNGYSYIIHAAGITKARSQDEYNSINALYTLNLAKAAAGNVKKFVFISSLAAMGPLNSLNGLITADSAPAPVTAYGKSKLLAEQQLKTVAGLNYTILRPTAVYGPREKDIFIVLKQFAKGIEPYIGRTEQKLSFIYVKDLAAACIKALHTTVNGTYNLSDGNFYDRYQLADLSKDILKLKTIKFHLPVNFVRLIAGVSEKISSFSNKTPALNIEKLNELTAVNWACSIEEAKHDLGYYPAFDLKKGLTETLNWYKANKWL
jgi:UDP-glucose 4-epimerase